MSKERLISLLLAPRISEKTTNLQKYRQYVFRVHVSAFKKDIIAAIKELFKVEVDKVRICNVKGKKRRFGQSEGRKKDWKKAYVTLKEGQTINLEAV